MFSCVSAQPGDMDDDDEINMPMPDPGRNSSSSSTPLVTPTSPPDSGRILSSPKEIIGSSDNSQTVSPSPSPSSGSLSKGSPTVAAPYVGDMAERLGKMSEEERNLCHLPTIISTKEVDSLFEKYTMYILKVVHRSYEWFVERRYSEFVELNKKLRSKMKEKPSWWPKLPPKQLSKHHPELIQYRQQILNWYIQTLSLQSQTRTDEHLVEFLSPPSPHAPNILKVEIIKYEMSLQDPISSLPISSTTSPGASTSPSVTASPSPSPSPSSSAASTPTPSSFGTNHRSTPVPTQDIRDILAPMREELSATSSSSSSPPSQQGNSLWNALAMLSPRQERSKPLLLTNTQTSVTSLQAAQQLLPHMAAMKMVTIDLMPPTPTVSLPSNISGSGTRDKVAYECYTSEYRFVRALDLVLQVFLKPLRVPHQGDAVLADSEIEALFGNVEKIYEFNRKLLTELEQRIENWSDQQLLGDIFLRLGPFFKMYSEYMNGFDAALELYLKLQKRTTFSTFLALAAARRECAGLDLPSLLVQPVQRPPRIVMLLEMLSKHTLKDHPDFANLEAACTKIKEITGAINASIKSTQNVSTFREYNNILHLINDKRTMEWEGNISFHAIPILVPQSLRQDEKAWQNMKSKTGAKRKVGAQPAVAYIFNDMVYIATEIQKFEIPFPHLWVEEPPEPGSLCLCLRTPEQVFVICMETAELSRSFFLAILGALKNIEGGGGDNRTVVYSFAEVGNFEGILSRGKLSAKGKISFTSSPYHLHYDGFWENNAYSGYGSLAFTSGAVYEGGWLDGKPNGDGSLTIQNGPKYVGGWKSGLKNGRGQILYSREENETQEIFVGEFVEDFIAGYGHVMCADYEYEGAWDCNLQHGKGAFSNVDYTYEGDWLYGLRHGDGRYHCTKTQETYEGHWKADKYDRKGTLVIAEGRYDGEFDRGLRHGKGVMEYADGGRYEGSWAFGKKSGEGKLIEKDSSYEGSWLNDWRQGTGTQTYADGAKYVGNWLENKRHGWGVWTGVEGSKYEGEWMDDKRDGKGTLTNSEGKYVGHFSNGKTHGHGVFTNALDKTVFEGEWVAGKRHGKGTVTGPGVFSPTVAQIWAQGVLQTTGRFDTIPTLPLPSDLIFSGYHL